jgi:hypothetical protein
MLQQELALVGASLGYLVPVVGLIAVAQRHISTGILCAAPLPVFAMYSFFVVIQLTVELQSRYLDRLEEELEKLLRGSAGALRVPIVRREIVGVAYASSASAVLAVLSQVGVAALTGALLYVVFDRVSWNALAVVAAVVYALWVALLLVVGLRIAREHGGKASGRFDYPRGGGAPPAG